MLTKTKKILFLSSGLAGALAASSVAGVALSSCTVETVNGGSNSSSGITLPDTWYNKDINWTDATSLNNLLIDDQGFVYSNKYMTEIIAILPGYGGGTLTIPASVKTISGYNKVTTVSGQTTKTPTGAFEGLTSLTKVVFAGNNVTQIGARAFSGCTGLQNITLPSSVTLVDTNAFNGCTSLNSINLDKVQYIGISAFQGAMTEVPTGSVSLNLNNAVLIGSNAFSGATGIGSVDFSKNSTLTQIADGAFSDCTSLAGNIDLSNASKLITIGSATAPSTTGSSFLNTAITNVYLPATAGLRTIAASTFSGCSNLVTVAPKGITGFKATESISGIYNQAFNGTKITSADISSVSSSTPLYAGAFSGMAELASVNLGTAITTIPASCFMNCSVLTSLTLPASITSISGGTPQFGTSGGNITFTANTLYPAFYGSGLKSIDLSTVTSYVVSSTTPLNLPDTLFYNCASLESIVLKDGTTSIGQGTFAKTTALSSITTKTSTKAGEGYTATKDITSVGKYAFWESGITSVDISAITNSSYSDLLYLTFTSCPNLTTIKLPSTIKTIAAYAVNDTPKLTTVNFGDLTLSSIGDYNFLNCNLTEVDLTKTTISNFGDSTNNLFSGLSADTVVKLSPYVWNISSGTSFTYNKKTTDSQGNTTSTLTKLNVTFPNGFAPTNTSNFNNGNLTAHEMFGRISSSLDMSSFTKLKSIGLRTFFGGPVSGLTFNASTFADGKFANYNTTNPAATYSFLGFLGANATSGSNNGKLEYASTSLPFGNMANLQTINFNKFSGTTSSNSDSTDVMAKTTEDTWNQVARIISSFGKEKADTTPDTSTNLTSWQEADTITAVVSKDSASSLVSSVVLKSSTDSNNTVTIDSTNNTSGSIKVAGVTWSIKVDATAGTITITSSNDVDTYRVLLPNSSNTSAYQAPGYKAFFNTKTETVTPSGSSTSVDVVVPNSSITVTLNVVPAASSNN